MCGQVTDKAGPWHTINGRSYLRAEKLTIPQLLGQNGYQTAMFGKWHLGDNYPYRPHDRGFQHALYHGGGGVNQTPDFFGNDYFDDTYFVNGKPKKFNGYCTDVFFTEAIQWLKKRDESKPFFMYISTNAPHGPLIVDKKYRDMYPETYEGKKVPREFFGMITNIDENFGKLEKQLNKMGLSENTLLVFTTDNGSAGGKGFYNAGMKAGKGSNYDGGHRVPFIARWPQGKWMGGKDIDRLTAHVDVLPTFMSLAGVNIPSDYDLDGKDITPLIAGENWEDRILFTDSQRIYTPKKWKTTSVMSERWRLLENKLLFDIDADPGQEKNVAAEHPEVVARLSKAYDKMWAEMEPGFAEPTFVTVGTPYENPAVLTCHDWRGDISAGQVPWNQRHIVEGINSNGYWTANFAKSGKYRFRLRRWPPEIDWTIHFLAEDSKFNMAKLQIDKKQYETKIYREEAEVVFELDVKKGLHDLKTFFCIGEKEVRGAYYLVVELL
jgi:arylsulfatase B